MKRILHQLTVNRTESTHFGATTKDRIWAGMPLQEKALPPSSNPPQPIDQIKQRRIDPASLQFRLVLGVTTFSVLGLSGVAAWTNWKIEQILVNTHSQNVKQIAEQLPENIALKRDRVAGDDTSAGNALETSVQQAINSFASPNVLLWVKSADGKMLARSAGLAAAPQDLADQLLSLSDMPLEPKVYAVGRQYFVLCSNPLEVQGQTIGQLYLAQNITADQLKRTDIVRGLSLVSSLLVIAMATAIALYIRQALRPLREINQIAGTISANDLSQSKLSLSDAPTEVQELAETLNEMLSRLGQSWEQQKQLIDDISHELRTPLSVAYGSLQCMQRRSTSLNEMHQEMLETAVSETQRTIQLLQDLLELARADSGCMYMHSETLVLNDLVADLVKMTKQLSDRVIHVEAEQDKIRMTTDRNCLNQILQNLIDNAVKYSTDDELIVIKLAQVADQVTIQVQDYGCGIDLKQQERIFDRFYRVDNARSRATGGTGLGLAIVKTLVETMNGEITVWSEPGAGSLFTVTLPSQLKG